MAAGARSPERHGHGFRERGCRLDGSHDMVTHMKTTVDIPDPLLTAVKEVAALEKTTLRSLIEEGLRLALARRRKGKRFRLRDASVDGNGPQPGVREGDWSVVRDLIYEGRGG